MQSQHTTPAETPFSPHPGKIVFKALWNHSARVESAEDVPDANKFVYYNAEHQETTDPAAAATRVPIVEVEMSSFDADGNLVEPAHAVRVSVSEYGLHHQELRHSSGPGPGLQPRH